MLDIVSNCIVTRVRRRQVSAISRPNDILALLQAFASAKHSSVVRCCAVV